MPKVSVIVPVYKVEKYIGQCIESILSQTFKDFELILVDDGSPDSSGAICDQYAQKDTRIQVIHKTNGGVSSARNYGIEKSTGTYLCFIDSDDIVSATYLEDFGTNAVESDWYMQGYKKVKSGVIVESHNFSLCNSSDYWTVLAYSEDNCIINSPCFKLYRSSIVKKYNIRFDSHTSYGEDHLFSLDFALYTRNIHYSEASGYLYRLSETESLTQRVVPYKEITYYAMQAVNKQHLIKQREHSEIYSAAVDRILFTNFIRTLKYTYAGNCGYNAFSWVIDAFSPNLKSIDISSLPTNYKVLMFFVKANLMKPLYPLFKVMLS